MHFYCKPGEELGTPNCRWPEVKEAIKTGFPGIAEGSLEELRKDMYSKEATALESMAVQYRGDAIVEFQVNFSSIHNRHVFSVLYDLYLSVCHLEIGKVYQ